MVGSQHQVVRTAHHPHMTLGLHIRCVLVIHNLVRAQHVVLVAKLRHVVEGGNLVAQCLPIGLPTHRLAPGWHRLRLR